MIYSTCAVAEQENPFKEGDWLIDLAHAFEMFNEKLRLLLLRLNCDTCTIYVSSNKRDNFRNALADDYKLKRKERRLVTGLIELKQLIIDKLGAIEAHGAEADDYCVQHKWKSPEALLVAIDKDVIYQCHGTHYNYWKEEYIEVSKEYADYFKYYQAIVGDTSDNYKGVPGIGSKKVNHFIQVGMSEKELQEGVLNAFKSKGLDTDKALQQIRLADMRQFDLETKEVKLFEFILD